MSKRKYGNIFLFLFFAFALNFFGYRHVETSIYYGGLYLCIVIMFIIILKRKTSVKCVVSTKFSGKYPILFVLLSFVSALSCYIYRGQPISNSVIGYLPLMGLGVYYVCHVWNVRELDILKIIFLLAIIRTGITFVQLQTFPVYWFGNSLSEYDETLFDIRGGMVRFFLSLAFWLPLLLFLYSVQELTKRYRTKYLLLLLISAGGLYMDQSRTILVSAFVAIAYIMIYSKGGKSQRRLFNIILFVGIVVILILNFDSLFGGLQKLTKSDMNKEYIRLFSYQKYLFDYWNGSITFLFGNGLPHDSHYAKEIEAFESIGLYRADVGIVGSLNEYGLFFVILFVAYLVKVYRYRKYVDSYLLAYCLFSVLYLLLYFPINYDKQSNVFFALFMYLIDKSIERNMIAKKQGIKIVRFRKCNEYSLHRI